MVSRAKKKSIFFFTIFYNFYLIFFWLQIAINCVLLYWRHLSSRLLYNDFACTFWNFDNFMHLYFREIFFCFKNHSSIRIKAKFFCVSIFVVFLYWNRNSMSNLSSYYGLINARMYSFLILNFNSILLSYCGLINARMSASDKVLLTFSKKIGFKGTPSEIVSTHC